jgi:hypothetical protein
MSSGLESVEPKARTAAEKRRTIFSQEIVKPACQCYWLQGLPCPSDPWLSPTTSSFSFHREGSCLLVALQELLL